VLFAVAGLLFAALVTASVWNSKWFWRRVGDRVGPYLATAEPLSTVSSSGPTDDEFASAIDDLLDELATIHSRLGEAIDKEYYGYKFFLPSAEYTKHRNVISARSSEARAVLSEVYVQADALNNKMPGLTADGIEMAHVDDPDPVRLREIVSRGQAMLRNLRP
jgi:hypothetical protein